MIGALIKAMVRLLRHIGLVDQSGNNTYWTYDAEGRQTRKTYSDASYWDYAFDAAGRMISRTDAKSQTTVYQYDAVGNLTNINYPNDADVSFAYDALNRKTSMVDGIGTTTYAYSSCCGLLESEDGPFANDTLYFDYTDAKQLASITSAFQNVAYTYDNLQRLKTVVGPEGTNTYSYEGAGTVWRELEMGNGMTVTRQFDDLLRLTNLVNGADAGVLSSFAITVDNADQRTQVIREDGTRYNYGYDAIGQLTNAAATLPDQTPWKAYQFGYQYDNTGNPVEQDKNGLVFSNSFNHLNQNVATVPGGSLAVLGRVNYAGGTVAVNSVQAQLSPDLIFAAPGIPFTLGTNTLNTVFTDPFGRSTNRETSVVVSQKAYQYDANGNLTNDGRMAYFWNDENRLVAVRSAKTGALIQQNRYDGLGRRRERIQSAVAGGDDPGSTNQYIYQGWLVLAVTDGEGNALETYTNGADLSGQVGGDAGGIGGILSSTQVGGPAYYQYDYNGNIIQVNASNQTLLTKLTYSPFGEVLLKEGSFISRYQFSTKEYDACTGLNYYGFRYYNPGMGRWINMDPIGERGGLNIHATFNNDPVDSYDPEGLAITITNIKNLNAGSTSSGARGTVSHPFSVSVSCNPAYTLRVTGSFTLTMTVLGPGNPAFSQRFSRYDAKWGTPRTDAREREAVIAHEEDHYQTYISFETALTSLNGFEGTACCKCSAWASALNNKINNIYNAAVSHSQSFDSSTWWDGGNYSQHSFTHGGMAEIILNTASHLIRSLNARQINEYMVIYRTKSCR